MHYTTSEYNCTIVGQLLYYVCTLYIHSRSVCTLSLRPLTHAHTLNYSLTEIGAPLTHSLKWSLCCECTESVKCCGEPFGSLHSSSSRSITPVVFCSIRSGEEGGGGRGEGGREGWMEGEREGWREGGRV